MKTEESWIVSAATAAAVSVSILVLPFSWCSNVDVVPQRAESQTGRLFPFLFHCHELDLKR